LLLALLLSSLLLLALLLGLLGKGSSVDRSGKERGDENVLHIDC
jgi:hypothetical protein